MCGIFGLIARAGRFDEADVRRATETLVHRGPDDLGVERVHASERWDVFFGHTRLSIVDLSEHGHQPLRVGEGTIVFNGEIYNHRSLRPQISRALRSTSDTEVLLSGLLEHGEGFLRETNGMFAFGAWAEPTRTLTLARDRLGKKPLYLYEDDEVFAFASELKAFVALGLPLHEDATAWAHYHWLRHVPGTRTIYRECRKMPAASVATLTLPAGGPLPRPSARLFWDPLRACGERFEGSYDDAIDEVLARIDEATRIRLQADVPVGVFLSGGIDSSLIAASVAATHDAPVAAYIVKAADPEMDESDVAVRTAEQLGLEPHVLHLRVEDYHRQIQRIPESYDEPCSPISQIPTMAIAEAARRYVKVVLTGDGGDEVFVGYPWFGYPERLFRYRAPLDRVPFGRTLAGAVLPSRAGRLALAAAVRVLGLNADNLEVKRHIAMDLLRVDDPATLYDHFQQLWPRTALPADERALLGPERMLERARQTYPDYAWDALAARSVPERVAALEMVTAMRDEILVKVDRGTMAYSLEARSPLLDHRVVELGMCLPIAFKAKDGVYKRVLRDACARRVNRELSRRKKSGFGIPPPPGLPPGPSIPVRWARAVEQAWRARWTRAAS